MLVGRAAECARIDLLLAEPRAGRRGVMCVWAIMFVTWALALRYGS